MNSNWTLSITECTQVSFDFPPVKRRRIEARFSGGDITSDGGLLLLRQADRRLGLLEAVNARLPDPRDGRYVRHDQLTLRMTGYMASRKDGSSTATTMPIASCPCTSFVVISCWSVTSVQARSMVPSTPGLSWPCWLSGCDRPGRPCGDRQARNHHTRAQPTFYRHQSQRRCPAALRPSLLYPWRDGEPHQGAATGSVRRSHQRPSVVNQSAPPAVIQSGLCADGNHPSAGIA